MDSPFLRPYEPGFDDMVTDGAVHVLARHGVDRFSISKMARWMGLTPAALLNDHSRARLIEIVMITFGQRWLEWSGTARSPDAPPIRLPENRGELQGVRVWADLGRLAVAEDLRGNAAPLVRLGQTLAAERSWLVAVLRAEQEPCCLPSDADVGVLMALVAGLRLELSMPAPALGLEEARAVVRRGYDALTSHHVGCVDVPEAS